MSNSEQKRETQEQRADEAGIQQEILRAVKDVRFGSVEVVIHDSKVVQVERREKIRFQK